MSLHLQVRQNDLAAPQNVSKINKMKFFALCAFLLIALAAVQATPGQLSGHGGGQIGRGGQGGHGGQIGLGGQSSHGGQIGRGGQSGHGGLVGSLGHGSHLG